MTGRKLIVFMGRIRGGYQFSSQHSALSIQLIEAWDSSPKPPKLLALLSADG
jgi:hypothetical protein